MTVVIFLPPHGDNSVSRRQVGVVRQVQFVESDRLVIGRDSVVVHRVTYRIRRLRVSTRSLSRLSKAGRRAFLELLRNPDSRSANARFRRALPQRRFVRRETGVVRYSATPRVQISTRDCPGARVGPGHRIVVRHQFHVRDHGVDIGDVLRCDPAGVRRMARSIHEGMGPRKLRTRLSRTVAARPTPDLVAGAKVDRDKPSLASPGRGTLRADHVSGAAVGTGATASMDFRMATPRTEVDVSGLEAVVRELMETMTRTERETRHIRDVGNRGFDSRGGR
jgi:hypothetical protein